MKIVQGMVYGVLMMVMGIFVLGKTTHISIDEMFDTTAAQRSAVHKEYATQETKKNEMVQKVLRNALKEERAMKTILYIASMYRHEDVDTQIAELHELVDDDVLRDKFGWTKDIELKFMLMSYMEQRDRYERRLRDKKISDADRATNRQLKVEYEAKIDSAFNQLAQLE